MHRFDILLSFNLNCQALHLIIQNAKNEKIFRLCIYFAEPLSRNFIVYKSCWLHHCQPEGQSKAKSRPWWLYFYNKIIKKTSLCPIPRVKKNCLLTFICLIRWKMTLKFRKMEDKDGNRGLA
jgi:hypothetical protein